MKCYPGRLLPLTALPVLAVAACGTQTASTTSAGLSPITVGVDEPLTGSFNTDGIASLRGYQLWASDVNGVGGLLGRPVKRAVLLAALGPGRSDHREVPLRTACGHRRRAKRHGAERSRPVLHEHAGHLPDGALRQLGPLAAAQRAAQDRRLPDGP